MPFTASTAEPAINLDPYTAQTKKAIDHTKKFIASRGLVCYGGTALDYAARLQGGRIYDDEKLALPDLDFFSADPLRDARDLADILYADGYEDARVINAYHVGTFRVDCGGNHFIADVSYCPIIASLRTLTYEGFRVIHPDYQRLDMHSSLSFVYDNPPREVAFARIGKDVERFNIIDGLYPLPLGVDESTKTKKDAASARVISKDYVYAGMTAYALHMNLPVDATAPIEIASHDPEELITSEGMEVTAAFDQLTNIFPIMYFTVDAHGRRFIIYDTTHRLLSINTKDHVRFACANYVLRSILAWWLVSNTPDRQGGRQDDYPWRPAISLAAYHTLLPRATLSAKYYGDENIDHGAIIKAAEYDKLTGIADSSIMDEYTLPVTYRPSKSMGKRDDEPYDYAKNIFFHIDGRRVDG